MQANTSKTVRVKGFLDGYEKEFDIIFIVSETESFHYGNETSTFVEYLVPGRDVHKDRFDTRYFDGDLDDFINCYVQNWLNSSFKIVEQ